MAEPARPLRLALVQFCAGDDPPENARALCRMVAQAAGDGAQFVATPEVSNIVSLDRDWQQQVLCTEAEDATLAALRAAAAEHGITLLVGSLALKAGGNEPRFVNRSFLIGPDGAIVARYDKIHMFDVDLPGGERYRESAAYRPGTQAVLAEAGFARIGLTVCYDLRFPHLYRQLAQAGAEMLTVPAAFSPVSGQAHWEVLLRARAIENGAFVVAPAQVGDHPARHGRSRRTWGHAMVVDPWGEVLLDAGEQVGVHLCDIDLGRVADVRARIPSLDQDRSFSLAP